MSRRLVPVARALIRRYPAPWRDRYEDELLALVEDVPPRPGDLVDLARGCLVERARALVEPAERPWMARVLIGAIHLVVPLALVLGAWAAGTALKATFGPLPDVLTYVWLAAWLALLIATLGLDLRASARTVRPHAGRWMVAAAATAAFGFWSELPSVTSWYLWLWVSWRFLWITDVLGLTGRQISETLDRLGGIRNHMSWARMELTRCETLASQGIVTGDLDRARAEMARLEAEHDAVMQSLREMGYRARVS